MAEETEPKQSKASGRGTGLFDYEMLQSLQSIQGGISDLKNIIKKQEEKGYEESRKALRLNMPKPSLPRLPRLPNPMNLVPSVGGMADFFMQAAKAGLIATFLVGLLKETIGKWFDSLTFDKTSIGGLIGAGLQGLLTQDPGDPPLLDRFKSAFERGAISALVAGAVGGVVLGPIGMVAGAILGLAGGMLYDFILTDKNKDTQALANELRERFAKARTWAILGGALGLGAALLLGPVGLLSGVLIGAAAGAIYGFLSDRKQTDEEKVNTMIADVMDNDVMGPMRKTMKFIGKGFRNFFKRIRLHYYMAQNDLTEAEALKERPDLAPTTADTPEIGELEAKIAELNKKGMSMGGGSLMQSQRNRMEKSGEYPGFEKVVIPENIGWFDAEVLRDMSRQIMGPRGEYIQAQDLKPGDIVFMRSRYKEGFRIFEASANLNKDLYDAQLKHHLEGGGDAPDREPPAGFTPSGDVPGEKDKINIEIELNKNGQLEQTMRQIFGATTLAGVQSKPQVVVVEGQKNATVVSGGGDGQGGTEIAMSPAFSGDKKNDGLQTSFFGFAAGA